MISRQSNNRTAEGHCYDETSHSHCLSSSISALFPIIECDESQDEDGNSANCQTAMSDEALRSKPLARSRTVISDLFLLGKESSSTDSPAELPDGKNGVKTRQDQGPESQEVIGSENEVRRTKLFLYPILQAACAILDENHNSQMDHSMYSSQEDNVWGQFVTPEAPRPILRPSSAGARRIQHRAARSAFFPYAVLKSVEFNHKRSNAKNAAVSNSKMCSSIELSLSAMCVG